MNKTGIQKISGGVAHRIPNDLKEALLHNPISLNVWGGLTPLARNEWICWIELVKKQETRQDHIKRTITELKEGMRRPCCWLGCIHRTDKQMNPSQKYVISKRSKK